MLNEQLHIYISEVEDKQPKITAKREKRLREISAYISEKLKAKKEASLIFICTHNSRRSHLCQVWAATFAARFGFEGVKTFSGGTEATAFNPRAVEALQRAGFSIENPGGENPHYRVFFDGQVEPLVCFSKTFDDAHNPQQDFAAVMTCSDADKNCPLVPGADQRFSIPYKDPKESDGTPKEKETYDERCRQIAEEMFFMISQV